jgi:hypothetical protein
MSIESDALETDTPIHDLFALSGTTAVVTGSWLHRGGFGIGRATVGLLDINQEAADLRGLLSSGVEELRTETRPGRIDVSRDWFVRSTTPLLSGS